MKKFLVWLFCLILLTQPVFAQSEKLIILNTNTGRDTDADTGQNAGAGEQNSSDTTENTDNVNTQQTGNVDISAPSALLMEASTGQVIYEKDADSKRPPASVTKVMTLLLIFDALQEGKIHLEDEVTTSEYAASMGGSQVFLEEGETQDVETMIKCIVIASGNDASVAMAEHIGDHTALSTIINKDLLKNPGLDKTLLGDGIATFVAGALGGPANTTYGENTSVVGMTKIASVWVIGLAAIIAICLGFLGKFTAVVSSIPQPVLGGVSLLLYGFISVNGLKVLVQKQMDFEDPKNVVVASTMLVLGLGGAAISIVNGDFSITISGMSLAAVVGILLNLCIPNNKEEKKKIESADAKKEKETIKV